MDFFGIASPSKQMAWVGKMLVEGLSNSIEDNGDEAVKAAENMSSNINDVMNGLAKDMQTAIPTQFNAEVQAQATGNLVNGLVSGLSSVMGSQNVSQQPIVLQVVLDSKTIAQSIFDPLRSVAVQRGVALG